MNRIYLYPYAGPCGRNYFEQRGTLEDLLKSGLELKEGMTIRFYCDDGDDQGNRDDLLFEGQVFYDEEKKAWYAIIDSNSYRHASEEIA